MAEIYPNPNDATSFVLRWYHYLEVVVVGLVSWLATRVVAHSSALAVLTQNSEEMRKDIREIRTYLMGTRDE